VCEQELGKRRPRATGSTLATAGRLVSRPADLPPIRSAFASTVSERHDTAMIGLEVPGRQFMVPRRRQARHALPRPFIFMAYCSAFIMNGMAIALAVFYGSYFSAETSVAWAIATATSIVFEFLLAQPLWLMLTAFVQVRLHLMKTIEDEQAGNRVHHNDDAERQIEGSPSLGERQQQCDSLDSLLEEEDIENIELPVIDLIPGNIHEILAERIEDFIRGLLNPSANSTYNFVRDVSEVEFRRACGMTGLDTQDERVTQLWQTLELDTEGRAKVREVFEKLALSQLDKLIAAFFLSLDIVGERVRSEEITRTLGGYMEDSQLQRLLTDDSDPMTFVDLRTRFAALADADNAGEFSQFEITEENDEIRRMLETQLSIVLSRMDMRGARRQVLLPKGRPYVVAKVADLEEIQPAVSVAPATKSTTPARE
jgi:hypothetical protein